MHPLHRHQRNARRLGTTFWANATLSLAWAAMIPVTLLTSLKTSIPFLAAISVLALAIGHMSSALAALAGKAGSENAAKLHSVDEPPGP